MTGAAPEGIVGGLANWDFSGPRNALANLDAAFAEVTSRAATTLTTINTTNNTTVAPKADSAGLDMLIGKANTLKSIMSSVGANPTGGGGAAALVKGSNAQTVPVGAGSPSP